VRRLDHYIKQTRHSSLWQILHLREYLCKTLPLEDIFFVVDEDTFLVCISRREKQALAREDHFPLPRGFLFKFHYFVRIGTKFCDECLVIHICANATF
jgi:hypothetical protein